MIETKVSMKILIFLFFHYKNLAEFIFAGFGTYCFIISKQDFRFKLSFYNQHDNRVFFKTCFSTCVQKMSKVKYFKPDNRETEVLFRIL